jgi:hypothetical protein
MFKQRRSERAPAAATAATGPIDGVTWPES